MEKGDKIFLINSRKKAQLTIFIIFGLIIFSVVMLFLFLETDLFLRIGGKLDLSPEAFLDFCINEEIREAVNLISLQGGCTDPVLYQEFQFSEEDSRKIAYLCYTQNYLLGCSNQKPDLRGHIEKEIYDYVKTDVKECFQNFETSLSKKGFAVDSEYNDFSVNILPK